jgi:hypothetical protein
MDTKNEKPDGNSGAGAGKPQEANADAKNTKMDINRYLQKANHGKSIADMLRVLFKGQMATETEWADKVNEVVNRRAV